MDKVSILKKTKKEKYNTKDTIFGSDKYLEVLYEYRYYNTTNINYLLKILFSMNTEEVTKRENKPHLLSNKLETL